MLIMKESALFSKLGLELGLGGIVGGAFLLQSLEFLVTGGSGSETLLSEGDGLGSESFVDASLDGVDHSGLRLTVPGGGSGQVEATLADGVGQVGDSTGFSDLTVHEGGEGVVVVELVVNIAFAESGKGVAIRGAQGGVGVVGHGGEVVGERITLASTTSRTLGDGEHGAGDEGLEFSLQEPGKPSELHGLGDDFHPSRGAVGEEGILGVRDGHAEQYLLKIPIKNKVDTA